MENKQDDIRLCEKINLLRKRKGVSQGKLSVLTGYTQAYISLLESGKRTPSYDNLVNIAGALGCSIEEISNHNTKDHLSEIVNSHVEGLSEIELEKVIDYIELIKRGRG
jgi:transcriptional regulator with XRE-family HTH domain